MSQSVKCPKCGSADVMFSRKKQLYICEDCAFEFRDEKSSSRRVYLSYGGEKHILLAERIKNDLIARGHQVWYDRERAKGGDREKYVDAGLDWIAESPVQGRFIVLLTPESVRRPDGHCLDEIARAVQRKLPIMPLMVSWCQPPLSICRIQWLDMMDCQLPDEKLERCADKFRQLSETIEMDSPDYSGVQSRLLRILEPLPLGADIQRHLARFTGRQWIFRRVDAWLADPQASRIFWIVGPPGVGKTAIASWLASNRKEVAAFHLCSYGDAQKSDPRRAILSIAYQLSTQLPDYQSRLSSLNLEKIARESNAKTLFDQLIIQPLSVDFPDPGSTIAILIDALDEATRAGKNELADLIASEFGKAPKWLRLIITSRPESEVMQPLQGLTPYMLDTSSPENEQDIREYLARELKPFTPDSEVSAKAIDTIASRSEGIFLYVEWIRQELAQKRLSLDRLQEFPLGLAGVYSQFFHRQYPKIDRYRGMMSPVLETVVAALEPLTIGIIQKIFRWDEYDQADFCQDLGAMFPITDGRVQPFHRSIIDWLTDASRARDYYIDAMNGHVRLSDYGWQEYARGVGAMSDYMLAHLPAHLIRTERWEASRTILTDISFFEIAWKLNEFDVKAYWSHIEEKSPMRIVDAYKPIIEAPQQYDGHSSGVASLLFGTGHYGESLALYDYLIKYYGEKDDRGNLKDALGKKGIILNYRGQAADAMEVHREEERICRLLNDRFGLQNCLANQTNVLLAMGDLDGISRVLREMDSFHDQSSKRELAKVLHVKALVYHQSGNLADAMKLYREKEHICREIKDFNGLWSALNNQACIFFDQGDFKESLRLNQELEGMCREHGNRYSLQYSLINQSDIYDETGNKEKAMALLKEAEQIERELGHKNGLHRCLGNLANILHDTGLLDEAVRLHEEEVALCREIGDRNGDHIGRGNLALVYYDRGMLGEAIGLLKEKEKMAIGTSSSEGTEISIGNQGLIFFDLGRPDDALELHRKEEAICREMGMKKDLHICLCNQASILYSRGEQERAMAMYLESERAYRELDYKIGLLNCLNSQSLIYFDRGEREEALRCIREAEEIGRTINYRRGLQASLGNRAVISYDTRNPKGSLELLKDAERLAREIDHKESLAISLIDQAIILAYDCGQISSAITMAREACDIVDACGMEMLARRIRPARDQIEGDGMRSLESPKLIPWTMKIPKFQKK